MYYMHDLYACWLLGTSITSALLCVKCEVLQAINEVSNPGSNVAPETQHGVSNLLTTTTAINDANRSFDSLTSLRAKILSRPSMICSWL